MSFVLRFIYPEEKTVTFYESKSVSHKTPNEI